MQLFNYTDDSLYVKATTAASHDSVHAASGRKHNNTSAYWSVNSMKLGDKDALIIINGVKQEPGDSIRIPFGNEIDELKIIKKEDARQYGPDGKNGVILITTKRSAGIKKPEPKYGLTYKMAAMNANIPTTVTGEAPGRNLDVKLSDRINIKNKSYIKTLTTTAYRTSGPEGNVTDIINNKDTDYKKAYIRINGKEAGPDEIEKLHPNKITTIIVMNGNENLIRKFGPKAINGAIIIETKGYRSDFGPDEQPANKNPVFRLEDSGNTGFIIFKKSQKHDFKFYTEKLKDIGVKLKYSDIERNKEGEIISIKIELVDTKFGNKASEVYPDTNGKPIPEIYVGRRNGDIVILAQPE